MTRPGMVAVPAVALALAATIAGMLFAPVFGATALLLPVGVPAVAVLATALICTRRDSLATWRPVLGTLAGLLAVVETSLRSTTVAGLPTARTLGALISGVTDSWQLTLQSTWPARPEPALLLFVPLLVVLAGVCGIELHHRAGSPLLALAPSFAVAVLSQFYAAAEPVTATAAALGYAVAAGSLLAARTGARGGEPPAAAGHPVVRRLPHAVASLGLAAAAALLAGALVPVAPAKLALEQRAAPIPEARVTNPLDEIAYRLAHPGTAVFRVSRPVDVDRWPLVVFDTFDGVNWTSADRYRRLGTGLAPDPLLTGAVERRTVEISTTGTAPWLPSQTWPAAVSNVDPLVEQQHGTLLLPGFDRPVRYSLSWWHRDVDAEALARAPIADKAPGGLGGVGAPPEGIAELARDAVRGVRPSFQAALVLERFFRENFRLATGESLPTGHGWPQLSDFLLHGRRGTSEQFAAAYVALARILGIPARLAVGFRAPAVRDPDGGYTVRNGDVLAWPEVAVQDVGWVPLDPTGGAATAAGADGGPAGAAARARSQLPAPEDLHDPPVAPPSRAGVRAGNGGGVGRLPWVMVVAVAVTLLIGWLVGVPAAKAVRMRRRRRRPGTGAVTGAVEEVRDRLCAHGVAVSTAMTPRDMAVAAATTAGATVDGLHRLAGTVDRAMWSGADCGPHTGQEAWAAVREVRHGLARRGWGARLRAAIEPRSLLPRTPLPPDRRSG